MNKFRFINYQKHILLPAICLLLSSCGSFFPAASTSPLSATSHIIHHGTTTTFNCGNESLHFASSGYDSTEFIDVLGKKRGEITSRLYVGMSGKPETIKDFRAYTGLTIYYYQFQIQVLRLGRDLQNPFTEASVGYMQQLESSVRFTYCA